MANHGGLVAAIVILAVLSAALVGASVASGHVKCVVNSPSASPIIHPVHVKAVYGEAGVSGGMLPSNDAYGNVVSGDAYAASHYAGHAQWNGNVDAGKNNGSSSCQPGPEPASFYPYGPNEGAAYDASYPNSESLDSKFPRGCGTDGAAQGYDLNVDSLMPASWRGSSQSACSGESAADSQWAKYAPSKQAFNNYIQAAGSARLSMNTRSPLGRQVGVPLLLRQGAPVPISSTEFVFNDSSFRQDLTFNSTGRYPQSTAC